MSEQGSRSRDQDRGHDENEEHVILLNTTSVLYDSILLMLTTTSSQRYGAPRIFSRRNGTLPIRAIDQVDDLYALVTAVVVMAVVLSSSTKKIISGELMYSSGGK